MRILKLLLPLVCLISFSAHAQQYELNKGWQCINIKKTKDYGEKISQPSYHLKGFMNATVPGTVLTNLLDNKMIPDPFYALNNEKIPDIYNTGSDYYTYWFVKDFNEKINKEGDQVWLHFRGINYSCDIFLNGHKLNEKRFYGMFLRQQYNITQWLAKDGKNRLAVIVYPPDPVGNPNGGQGGDGTIAKNVSHQYVAGWDWIQPIRDRNTGIWDKVTIEKTGAINIQNVHVITLVPGKRFIEGNQDPATIKVSAELLNAGNKTIAGDLQYELGGEKISTHISVAAGANVTASLPDFVLQNPKLWWPNGYGPQNLYNINVKFINDDAAAISDVEHIQFGVREINTNWNTVTRSREVLVNGQKIFIKGGNWIVSDEMLRLSGDRYDAEIRFHRDMNLNLIRVWGGALTERPEFYDACDKYGLLVMQDFWNSGDCNGRWLDPMKKEDQWTRRKYPDSHQLFLASVIDQVKMIRNHPSLALWCGGNEITPPEDILVAMRDSIIPQLDGTRYLIEYSNSDSMSYNPFGGNGDGPYQIQNINTFWEHQTFPFNSEVGSVGMGDYASLERFIPKENMIIPDFTSRKIDSVWRYHKYIGYDHYIDAYGKPKDVKDFADKAQLVNYDQYRALMEGFSAHMWEWYTGVIIWKTQNPWTALRGQMYDYYLDPNACLYGLHNGSEPFHVMYNPADGMVMIANNTFTSKHNIMLQVKMYDMNGKDSLLTQVFSEIEPTRSKKYLSVKPLLDKLVKDKGAFLYLSLSDENKRLLSDNLYWLPDSTGNYSGLQEMKKAIVNVRANEKAKGKVEVTVSNSKDNPVAFFNRLSLVNILTKKRILPTFYSDNYISVLPGEERKITIDYTPVANEKAAVELYGWNVDKQYIDIK
ncbi:glycosyl hydrolase [Ginsengibacter hankyongi]|uniref:Glycosyl hydrolase n=1 Tax=Ginsengibacter hankyongi TaxID=2607284 RepID=A0A5J5IN22_9BACT|nr:glycoside hydrolase family 2 TIM barrel-domain containing protein [Ginsengibacter hankyongi]KAA9040912.1 glycosyl hydrolase [Ginsengibacter hankyongi]